MPLSHWTDVSADWFPEVASGSRSSDSRGSREVDMAGGRPRAMAATVCGAPGRLHHRQPARTPVCVDSKPRTRELPRTS